MASNVTGVSELVDYREDEEDAQPTGTRQTTAKSATGNYVAVETAGFRDFYLKPQLIRALADAGFEHPSEVQHEAIPHAITGVDLLCQAKSGMGKTLVFVLSVLHELDEEKLEDAVYCLVIVHARELAFQIRNEFERFGKFLKRIRYEVFYGGVHIQKNVDILTPPKDKESTIPHIVIGTPGRLLALIKREYLKTDHIQYFILDECDKCLEKLDMRKDVQDIFIRCPRNKQVMMLTATLDKHAEQATKTTPTPGGATPQEEEGAVEGGGSSSAARYRDGAAAKRESMKEICLKYMQNPVEVIVDDEAKLTLHGLLQYYIKLQENQKNRVLSDLLDKLEFNQIIIFVKSVSRCTALDQLLNECSFPSIAIHSGLNQEQRIQHYHQFKNFEKRIMVATDIFGRGIDIERVNIVINYDMPETTDAYLHRVGRAGRFGTKGLAITLIANEQDSQMLNQVQARFEAKVDEMPDNIDSSQYVNQ